MPWHMISGVMLTMWRGACAAVDDVGHLHAGAELVGLDLHGEDGDWEVSMSARTAAGMSARGRGARSSRRKADQWQPRSELGGECGAMGA